MSGLLVAHVAYQLLLRESGLPVAATKRENRYIHDDKHARVKIKNTGNTCRKGGRGGGPQRTVFLAVSPVVAHRKTAGSVIAATIYAVARKYY